MTLPKRLYERVGKRQISWWVKAPDSTTYTVRAVPVTSTAEQIATARQAAIDTFNLTREWKAPTLPPVVTDWAASYGRVDAAAVKMVGGAPAWAERLYRHSKRRAAQRKIAWSLGIGEFNAVAARCAGLCEVSGVPLMLAATGLKGPYGPSLDRIDSRGPYAAGNVRIVCVAVNFALNSWGVDAFLPIAHALAAKHSYSKVAKAQFQNDYRATRFLT